MRDTGISVMDEKDRLLDDLFKEYRNLITRNAYLFVKDYHTAEDICQETFLRLAKHLDHVEPEKTKAWLIRVSERLALDYLKKGGKYKISVGLEGAADLTDDDYSDLSGIMEKREEYEQSGKVLRLLKKEKPQWFDAVFMSYWEDMDNHSIGKELGVKASLVSKWKERARRWLKDAYEREYPEEK